MKKRNDLMLNMLHVLITYKQVLITSKGTKCTNTQCKAEHNF